MECQDPLFAGRLHNNLTENAIRPFVIGRKNFLFCDTVAGANASANLYGLIETAKANDIEPYAYLKMLFTELPKANSLEDIEALLPLKEFHAKTARRKLHAPLTIRRRQRPRPFD